MEANDGSRVANSQAENGSSGTYALRDLISDIPLSTGGDEQAHITCVDAWNGNLYIGTSSGQVLHYVSIPPDPTDESGQPSYIFATSLEPPFSTKQEGVDAGVKQILLLPEVSKACILCNGTLTFYSLPELSPAYAENIKQAGCLWIGGLDADLTGEERGSTGGTVIVICLQRRLRLIKIGKEARKIRDIELGGVSAIQRRKDLACVADGNTYSLLDVVNHRKNELFPITSSAAADREKPLPDLPQLGHRGQSRSVSEASSSRLIRGHDRNVSLGGQPRDVGRLRPESPTPWPARRSSRQGGSPADPSSREESPAKSPEPSPRVSVEITSRSEAPAPSEPLLPNIVTPTPTEFLLTTGTKMDEVGIGIFINLDGDPSRAPLEFSSYPKSLVLDGYGMDTGPDTSRPPDSEGYVLALVRRKVGSEADQAIEIQRWDSDSGEQNRSKEWLMMDPMSSAEDQNDTARRAGLRIASSTTELSVPEISTSLRLRRLALGTDAAGGDAEREAEEDKFAARFAQIQARVLLYSHSKVQWVTRNPLILQLDR